RWMSSSKRTRTAAPVGGSHLRIRALSRRRAVRQHQLTERCIVGRVKSQVDRYHIYGQSGKQNRNRRVQQPLGIFFRGDNQFMWIIYFAEATDNLSDVGIGIVVMVDVTDVYNVCHFRREVRI